MSEQTNEEAIPDGINDLPDPTTFAAPPDVYRKPKKARKFDDGGSVTPTSLMDILTIILVFLLKSFSTDPVALKQADDLKPPFSFDGG